jgi:hypothetical protein
MQMRHNIQFRQFSSIEMNEAKRDSIFPFYFFKKHQLKHLKNKFGNDEKVDEISCPK